MRWLVLVPMGCSASGLDDTPEPETPEPTVAVTVPEVGASAPAARVETAAPKPCEPAPPACLDDLRLGSCDGGVARVELCARGCQPMPAPIPARCARDVEPPAEVVRLLSAKPYVEDRCTPHPARPGALACRYRVMGIDAEVSTRSPPPDRVARWIVDASAYAEPIDALFDRDRPTWEASLMLIARHVRNQSSRIFPVAGTIVEDLGEGPRAFGFDRGVVSPCDEGGCACRINSLKPAALCRYRDALGRETDATCRARLGGPAGIEAWRATCSANHEAALLSESNEHFRAAAWDLGRRVRERCPEPCTPAEVLDRAARALGLRR